MAQFFRHPPQVTFDADQMPHFAGITDDEPMVRRPHVPQRRKREQSGQITPNAVEATLLPGSSHGSFQNITQEPPVVAPFPSSTSISSLSPHNPNHMMHSPMQHGAGQTFASTASHLSIDTNALVAPVRPPTGSRSSTGLSNQSTPDITSPRLRSGQHSSNRHEPYRLPSSRNRYSNLEFTPSPHVENLQPMFPFPKQASLPNPGMDYYRNSSQQGTSESFHTPYSRSLEHDSWPSSEMMGGHKQDQQYTLAGSEPVTNAAWPMSNGLARQDAPHDFYAASSYMQTGQLATGAAPLSVQDTHAIAYGPGYPSTQPSHSGYSHPALYPGPSFYSRTPMQTDQNQQDTQPWYGRAQEEATEAAHFQSQQLESSHSQPILAPQAVQHLSGFLPQTCYSPLLPSSAAYANGYATDSQPSDHPQDASSSRSGRQVKAEPSSPGKQGTYDSNSQGYVTAPPPPSYTHPNETYAEEGKVSPSGNNQEDNKPVFHYQYPSSGMFDPPQMEDPRDS